MGRNFRTPNPTAEVGVYSDTGLSMARSRSRWLWLAMLPGVLLLTLGVVFLVLWIGFDASSYQEVLLKEVSGWLGRPVRIEGVKVGFLPPRLRLLGVEVGEASGRSGELLFTARYLDADLNLGALFGSEPAVQRFQVMEPTIYLRRNQSGKWNFASAAERPASPQGQEPRESSPELPVRDWYLREGTILIQRFGEDPVRLTSLEASLTDLSTSAPFPVEVQFRIGEAGRVRANARPGPLWNGSKGRLALTARVSLEDVAAEDLEQALGFSALPASVSSLSGSLELVLLEETSRLQGVFDLQVAEGQKLAPLGDWKLNGSARLSHLRCRVAEGADPIRADLLPARSNGDDTGGGGRRPGGVPSQRGAEELPGSPTHFQSGRGWCRLRGPEIASEFSCRAFPVGRTAPVSSGSPQPDGKGRFEPG